MPDPVVLVLGCGLGGIAAAREARRLLSQASRVIVIDRDLNASYPPSYLWVMTGNRRPESIRRNRARLARRGIEFVNAEVRYIDTENRYVRADSREFHYDYLILALGTETSLDTHPGLAEIAHTFYTLEGAERLAAALRYFAGGRILVTVAGQPIKSPTAPYEAAMLLEHYFNSRRRRQKVEIALYTPEAAPLPEIGPGNGDEIRGLLIHKGIALSTGKRLVAVDPARHQATFADGEVASFQLMVAVPKHRAPALALEMGLTDESGWVPVDPNSFETRYTNVFAVGDMTHVPLENGSALPKLGLFAEKQALTAAAVIAQREGRRADVPAFDASGRWFMETGAGGAAVAEGDFLNPQNLVLKQPSLIWHWARLVRERRWLWRRY